MIVVTATRLSTSYDFTDRNHFATDACCLKLQSSDIETVQAYLVTRISYSQTTFALLDTQTNGRTSEYKCTILRHDIPALIRLLDVKNDLI